MTRAEAVTALRAATRHGNPAAVRRAAMDLAIVMGAGRLSSPARFAAAFRYAARLLRAAGRPRYFRPEHTTIAGWA